MGLARRYILECQIETPSGMSFVIINQEISLLNGFSGVTDVGSGTTYSFPTITLIQLKQLTDEEYADRVYYFVAHVGNSNLSESARQALITGATYNEVLCG